MNKKNETQDKSKNNNKFINKKILTISLISGIILSLLHFFLSNFIVIKTALDISPKPIVLLYDKLKKLEETQYEIVGEVKRIFPLQLFKDHLTTHYPHQNFNINKKIFEAKKNPLKNDKDNIYSIYKLIYTVKNLIDKENYQSNFIEKTAEISQKLCENLCKVKKEIINSSPLEIRQLYNILLEYKERREKIKKSLILLNIEENKKKHILKFHKKSQANNKINKIYQELEEFQKNITKNNKKEFTLILTKIIKKFENIPYSYSIPQEKKGYVGILFSFILGFVVTFLYLNTEQVYSRIFIGMIGGAIFGYIFGPYVSDFISPLGDIFIRLIKMIVVPLVFASLSLGVLSLGDVKKVGKIGGKTIAYYLVTTSLAISIGLILANLIKPGEFISPQDKIKYINQYKEEARKKTGGSTKKEISFKIGEAISKSLKFKTLEERREFLERYKEKIDEYFYTGKPKKISIKEMIVKIVPTNPIDSMAKSNMLQIIFFSLIFGLVLATVGKEKKDIIEKGLDGINSAMINLVNWIMLFAPFGVFALMSNTVAKAGTSILKALAVYMVVVLLGLLMHILLVYGTAVRIFGKFKLIEFLKKARSVMLVAFSTSSSAATLPVTMKCAEEQFKVSRGISSFVLPLGATMNMDGTALYQGVAAVFIAQVYGIPLNLNGQLTVLFTATLASIGTAAVPGAGMIILAMVLQSIHVPLSGIALIIGVDRILDMCRTTVNVTGDLSATIFVHYTSKE